MGCHAVGGCEFVGARVCSGACVPRATGGQGAGGGMDPPADLVGRVLALPRAHSEYV